MSTEALEASKVGLFSNAISRALSKVSVSVVSWAEEEMLRVLNERINKRNSALI